MNTQREHTQLVTDSKGQPVTITARTRRKLRRRVRGYELGIMDETGRCLTRQERGLPPKQKPRVNLIPKDPRL